ncbi:class A beta-lactamase [Actinoallomurus purpureus]|uniref:class A beta-lactamase n=1 Tax=Actinoallomurus purpureus TaxID=478114 RepID=UPI0020937504|nr:class A beta-lactamase [Actinoallomurus purpureus]MCO6007594.1 class A beta-lactamase [Actinoallomurus purpureus]
MTNARHEDRSIRRRAGLAALAALALVPLTGCGAADHAATASSTVTAVRTPAPQRGDQAFQDLEKRYDARLGVWALDTGTGRVVAWRADERFAYASTHKVLSAGTVLRQDPMKRLDHVVKYTAKDIISNSPVTEKHVDTGMTIRELCDAALRYSDNTAANLLFREIGGPSGLGAALRRIGDRTTHVDRTEPALNTAIPGDVRDTSTPRQMGTDLRTFTLGHALPRPKRDLLIDWMRRNTTGNAVIRAGVPADWTVGDKTGSGDYGTRNDIAVAWPPHRAPIVFAVLSTRSTKDATRDDALIAAAAKVVAGRLT